MAADLIVYPTVLTGLDPDAVAFVPATLAGDYCPNDGTTFLLFKNGATQEVVVTVDSIRPCSHGQDHDSITTVPTDKRRMIGPFDKGRFSNENGKLKITYGPGEVTNLTVKAITVKPVLI